MLIQRVSLLILIEFMKFGKLKTTGHVCALEQDITTICNVLPRLPKDVVHHKITKNTKTVQISKKQKTASENSKVLKALLWLKENNTEHQDIELNMKIIDWMDSHEEKELATDGDSISCEMETEEEKHV